MEENELELEVGGLDATNDGLDSTGGGDEPKSDEDLRDVRNIKMKLRAYKKDLGHKLTNVDFGDVESSEDLDYLEEKLNEVRLTLSNSAAGAGVIGVAYFSSLQLAETLAGFTNDLVMLNGLTATCMKSQDINDALKELKIEYANFLVPDSPEKRLLMLTVLTASQIHMLNKSIAKKQLEPQVTPQVATQVTPQATPQVAKTPPVATDPFQLKENIGQPIFDDFYNMDKKDTATLNTQYKDL